MANVLASAALNNASQALTEGRYLDAKVILASAISEAAMAHGIKPVLTGGSAFDLLTANSIGSAGFSPQTSRDLDFVMIAADNQGAAIELRRLLRQAGFEPWSGGAISDDAERGWRHPKVPIPIEVLGSEYYGDPARLAIFEVDGRQLLVRGVEDTLWDCFQNAWHERNRESWTRALALMRIHGAELDRTYLQTRVEQFGYEEGWARLVQGKPL